MANLVATPLVNAKVYRHFAAVTIAITLCVAMFANGEARQTVTDEITRKQQAAKLREADTRKFGAVKIGDRQQSAAAQGSFGEDFDPSYGAGLGNGGSTAGSFNPHFASEDENSVVEPIAGPPPAVLSPDAVAALSPEEQIAYLKRLRQRKKASLREERTPDRAAIEAASIARSGSASSD